MSQTISWVDDQHLKAFYLHVQGSDSSDFGGPVINRRAHLLGLGLERVLEGEERRFFGGVVSGPRRQRYLIHMKFYPFYVGNEDFPKSRLDLESQQFWHHYDAFMDVFSRKYKRIAFPFGSLLNPQTDRTKWYPDRYHKVAGGPIDIEFQSSSYEPDYDIGADRVELVVKTRFPIDSSAMVATLTGIHLMTLRDY